MCCIQFASQVEQKQIDKINTKDDYTSRLEILNQKIALYLEK
jgi:hypothetical protein